MSGRISKRVGLFLLIFGVPLVFLYVLAIGDTQTQKLKFYGAKATDSGKTKINDFLFYDVDSNAVTKESLSGKSLIVTVLIPSCPAKCPIITGSKDGIEEIIGLGSIYNSIKKEKRLKDFIILSHLLDTAGNEVDLKAFLEEQPVDENYWKIVTGPENTIYDFNLLGKNLKRNDFGGHVIGGKVYYEMILLIDKNHFVRGVYQGDQALSIRRLQQEIHVLEREYAKETREKNVNK